MATILWGYVPLVGRAKQPRKKTTKRAGRGGPVGSDAQVDTRSRLIQAAMQEFNERGYYGTDTNKIARRAGFAPQTFYRWFKDKPEVFVAVYRHWEELERAMLGALLERQADTRQLVDAIVRHHSDYLPFRRSLRQLAVEDAQVRAARADSRRRQVAWILERVGDARADEGAVAAALLQTERLADALAEKELEDMSLPPAGARDALAAILQSLRDRKSR